MVVEIMTLCRYRGQKMEEREMKTSPSIIRIQTLLTDKTEYNLALLMIKNLL